MAIAEDKMNNTFQLYLVVIVDIAVYNIPGFLDGIPKFSFNAAKSCGSGVLSVAGGIYIINGNCCWRCVRPQRLADNGRSLIRVQCATIGVCSVCHCLAICNPDFINSRIISTLDTIIGVSIAKNNDETNHI